MFGCLQYFQPYKRSSNYLLGVKIACHTLQNVTVHFPWKTHFEKLIIIEVNWSINCNIKYICNNKLNGQGGILKSGCWTGYSFRLYPGTRVWYYIQEHCSWNMYNSKYVRTFFVQAIYRYLYTVKCTQTKLKKIYFSMIKYHIVPRKPGPRFYSITRIQHYL